MAGITIQNIADGRKAPDAGLTTGSIFRGIPRLNNANLGEYQPFIQGRGLVIITRMPTFMEYVDPDGTKRMKNIMEKGFLSFDGINDLTVNAEEINGGTNGSKYSMVTSTSDDSKEFTIKLPEFSGSPVSNWLYMWATGIMDPHSDWGTYHGLTEGITDGLTQPLEYSPKNHTMELMYIQFDPTLGVNGIEYACFIANAFPTKVPRNHFNTTKGDYTIPQIDVSLSGYKYENPMITAKAKKIYTDYVRADLVRGQLDPTFTSHFANLATPQYPPK